MNNNINLMINKIESNIEGTLEELETFKAEYQPKNKQYNINLITVLNSLERDIYTLEVLYNSRDMAHHSFYNSLLEAESKDLKGFIKEQVIKNQNILMYLSFYFDIE